MKNWNILIVAYGLENLGRDKKLQIFYRVKKEISYAGCPGLLWFRRHSL